MYDAVGERTGPSKSKDFLHTSPSSVSEDSVMIAMEHPQLMASSTGERIP